MSRIIWTAVPQATTTPSIVVDAEAERVRQNSWHVFVNGVFGGATVEIEYSPDLVGTSDANSIWYAPTVLQFTAAGDAFFWAKPRKYRVFVSGGGATTSINVEIR